MPLAVLRTNLPRSKIPHDFARVYTESLIKTLKCDPHLTMVEVHPDIMMARGGSTAPMVNLEFHHNDDNITESSKVEVARRLANGVVNLLKVPVERILVLFFDTRCTTLQSTCL